MKILLVITGGTISTVEKDGVMGIYGDSPYRILEIYRETGRQDIAFTVIEPVRMLSECNRPSYLEKIYYGILDALGMGKSAEDVRRGIKIPTKEEFPYDGILVTHGSDTLSYTAAFLSLAFAWLPVTLVLTAADFPVDRPDSNGRKNFSDAVDFICAAAGEGRPCLHKPGKGVFVVWKNRIGSGNLYAASELLEAGAGSDCFSSFPGIPLGEVVDGKPTFYRQAKKLFSECLENTVLDIHMEHDVFFLRPYPGLRYDLISLEHSGVKAVVHYLYHSATACMEEEGVSGRRYHILAFARYCKELEIPLFFAGFKSKDQKQYETNRDMLESGLGIPLYGVSPELAYMTVLTAYNQTVLSAEKLFPLCKDKKLREDRQRRKSGLFRQSKPWY